MKLQALLLISVFALSGCVVRTYQVTRDRVDQDLNEGNRGYIAGQISADEQAIERKATRTTQAVEIELYPPIRFENKSRPAAVTVEKSQPAETTQDTSLWGNRGFINQEPAPIVNQAAGFEEYTVQKNDTLQKISQRFYGTTKKWPAIYKANQDTLKGPDKLYPGQTLNIPVEGLKETKENLK